MKRTLLAVGLLLCGSALAVNSTTAKPSFADTVWYSNFAAVKANMAKHGYVYDSALPQKGTNDRLFTGVIDNVPVRITMWFNNKDQIVGTSVIFRPPSYPSKQITIYNTYSTFLDSKYGRGKETDTRQWKDEFLDLRDIADGKAELSKGWFFVDSGYLINLQVSTPYVNNKDVYASIEYVSPLYDVEVDRRSKASDF
ncbi:hypothetical protein [Deinococcus sonorensis]|uniref:DUF3298 domain-containing protein n=2 Tax=Deinococcus sonorensis TaxID=309891 RepID=A0AAU7UF09_9DEIO